MIMERSPNFYKNRIGETNKLGRGRELNIGRDKERHDDGARVLRDSWA